MIFVTKLIGMIRIRRSVCHSRWKNLSMYKLLLHFTTTWDFQQCGMCDQQSLRSACAYAQSDQSLCLSLEYSMTVKLLTEHHLDFLSLKGGCTGSTQSTHVKMPHCWKSHVMAQLFCTFSSSYWQNSSWLYMWRLQWHHQWLDCQDWSMWMWHLCVKTR